MADMRAHQDAMNVIAGRVIAGAWPKKTVTLDCTPGGGKTGAATLFTNRLMDGGVIDRVLWVVPRLSLAEQIRAAFSRGFGANPARELIEVDSEDDLFPPHLPLTPHVVGCVTTYQSIAGRCGERFALAVAAGRTLVIFDEVQFLREELSEVDRSWRRRATALKEAAAVTLLMSGTLWRTDGFKIPFVEYERRDDGKDYPLCDVGYSLSDAVRERAVLPTEWRTVGGLVEYWSGGEVHLRDMGKDEEEQVSNKIRTFLTCESTVRELLDLMVTDWRDWCRKVYHSRTLVMAENTGQARKWAEYLSERHSVPCVVATSREEAAGRKLRHFRERRHGQCLVTVGMAYVGFDCPDLTHLAYLNLARAPSWMLQSFARVSRFDEPATVGYDQQHAFVYAPDDTRMREFMTWVRAETEIGVRERRFVEGGGREPSPVPLPDDFRSIDAIPGGMAIESLHCRLSPAQVAALDAFKAACPSAAGIPHSQLHAILAKAGFDPGGKGAA